MSTADDPTRFGRQVRALRRRLALAGGALNVRLLTFDRLYAECLNAAGEAYTELSEPVLYRLIRSQLDHLTYYAPLVNLPGFTSSLQSLFAEFKAALITPEDLTAAVAALGNDARLAELALIYSRYQQQLHAQSSADRIGLGWLALEVLRATPDLGRDWPLLVIDGFDSFTPLELALLVELAGRVPNISAKHEGGDPAVETTREHASDILDYFMPKAAVLEREGLMGCLLRNYLDKHGVVNSTARALTEHGIAIIPAQKLHAC